ncbi:hypothetical protein Agabi119p4_9327 [Agaricus bisporus var. burnettii]|uniref:Uncharacterized protein n=1 Tax=Agaricus bisporus var. burnettii TaxID=192524 RepID=A0A8H7C4X0_AGABI|nr:hypothetical protein Agabi119p4_9327 [Agaricus bisporus var. burnettii]
MSALPIIPKQNSTVVRQYERNCSFRYLVFAPVRSGNGAKLSSAGLWLNASKSESVLETMMWAGLLQRKCCGGLSTNCNHNMGGGESFADDLNGNGICSTFQLNSSLLYFFSVRCLVEGRLNNLVEFDR